MDNRLRRVVCQVRDRFIAVLELTELQSAGEALLAVVIGSSFGDGFDIPAFDALFLAAPIFPREDSFST